MFSVNRHSAEVTAACAIQHGFGINDTADIIKHYANDTFDKCVAKFDSFDEAWSYAEKKEGFREIFNRNGSTWIRVEWYEVVSKYDFTIITVMPGIVEEDKK